MASTSALEDAPEFEQTDWERQAEDDDAAMQQILNIDPTQQDEKLKGLFVLERDVDQDDKADDAKDFGDISDDDLADEEEATGPSIDNPGLTDDQVTSHQYDDDVDDLFGEAPSSPFDFGDQAAIAAEINDELPEEENLLAVNFPEHPALSNQDPNIPAPAESKLDLVRQLFPGFEKALDFNRYLGPNPAYWIAKVPLKQPKPLQMNKVSLDLAPDQEKLFRAAGPARTTKGKRAALAEANGMVAIVEAPDDEASDEEGFDFSIPADDEIIGGRSYADIKILLADWDLLEKNQSQHVAAPEDQGAQDAWDLEFLGPEAKRRKTRAQDLDFFSIPQYAAPSFDNFLEDTARLGKRVYLDESDPYLLLEKSDYQNARKRQGVTNNVVKRGKLQKSRFNYSNDEAYDALKENQTHKVRGTLGNLTVEHSIPAIKMQWPYYRYKLSSKDARSYHRPSIKVGKFMGSRIDFAKPRTDKKRKHMARLPTQAVFNKAEDLTLADHYSSATLFEYSEEHPDILSNFGMGNRVINYYRRANAEDADRPQPDDKVGDTTVLLPEDQSPFSKFGMVDPGQTVRAIHNSMYRAPIFKHDAMDTDFLVIRNTTGEHGSQWHIRNIDNLFVVGQQLPLTEIPKPNARIHTSTDKNRLKMIVWRLMKKDAKNPGVTMAQITRHTTTPESTDRQKLKEFLIYDKNDKVYRLRQGDELPSEEYMRTQVTPDILCLLDAMQVGEQQAVDAGYKITGGDDVADDESKDIDERLLPWSKTRAFLEASQDKAMLMLHGEGDPSGCGLAINMLKVSMKGGYQGEVKGPNATSGAVVSAAERKANGGHTYNVKKQQEQYQSAIRTIWEKQAENLSSSVVDEESDEEHDANDEEYASVPAPARSNMVAVDDSASQFSDDADVKVGETGQIVRQMVNERGQTYEHIEVVSDPRVWKAYTRRRTLIEHSMKDVYDASNMNTGDAEADRAAADLAVKELARLERNKTRRLGREKAAKNKAAAGSVAGTDPENAGSPASTPIPTTEKASGTSRKCANCGQVGHIKTNKKYCPNCENNANSFGGGLSRSFAVWCTVT
ncbi:hypothetical protein BJ878DRAFT_165052 [Calycina marina]|uniref:Transcription initiation factor TFIID subunit 1 histone acetyltransferase domain-containing protein n=1 Tax=Calycina marina TaxID=1763456 RepID=A0A9P7YZ74_9HELO|nr:hypothetical protein BJ878DRAFT_165052 [Calycina marina]